MNRICVTLFVVGAIAVPVAYAQGIPETQLAQAGAGKTVSAMTEAEVRKVDKGAGKITLQHGEIKNLGMPAMTMVFPVKNKTMLDKVKAGDKVRFAADNVGGAVTIIEIEAAK